MPDLNKPEDVLNELNKKIHQTLSISESKARNWGNQLMEINLAEMDILNEGSFKQKRGIRKILIFKFEMK
jgi:hypothetical protein